MFFFDHNSPLASNFFILESGYSMKEYWMNLGSLSFTAGPRTDQLLTCPLITTVPATTAIMQNATKKLAASATRPAMNGNNAIPR